MDSAHIYLKLVEFIRNEIQSGALKPGSPLPAMRKMTEQWNCTTSTIMRAYQELARQGLVVSHVGRGTHVVKHLPTENQTPLRRAALLNKTEAFLLETMTAGYTPNEVEQSLRIALDRWRILSSEPEQPSPDVLRFVGSHDPAMALMAARYHDVTTRFSLQLSFAGSLGGLIALAEKKADLAGCHLWDEASNTYNEAFVRKLLPGQKVALLCLAHRQLGLIVAPGNPLNIYDLPDLARSDVRFVNRQPGSGTRVWLDAQLQRAGIAVEDIQGYADEKMTHSDVARSISKGLADAALGVETAALSFGLDFCPLTTERYDLAIPAENWDQESIQALERWLNSPQAHSAFDNLGGYDTTETGSVRWVS